MTKLNPGRRAGRIRRGFIKETVTNFTYRVSNRAFNILQGRNNDRLGTYKLCMYKPAMRTCSLSAVQYSPSTVSQSSNMWSNFPQTEFSPVFALFLPAAAQPVKDHTAHITTPNSPSCVAAAIFSLKIRAIKVAHSTFAGPFPVINDAISAPSTDLRTQVPHRAFPNHRQPHTCALPKMILSCSSPRTASSLVSPDAAQST